MGASLAEAAIAGAGYNVRINTKELPPNLAAPFAADLAELQKHAAELRIRISTLLHDRGL
jgi:formiminotetrahydrofolate cyclodeaminase